MIPCGDGIFAENARREQAPALHSLLEVTMKILVVGGGGREHAIIRSLKKNPEVTEIFAAPGNGGIAADATCVNISATDIDGIVAFAKEHRLCGGSAG